MRSVRLVPTVTIGGDTEGQPLLAGVSSLYATADQIYVLDPGSDVVNVYSHGGDFIRAIGRAGQGPGEFDRVYRVAASAQETVVLSKNGSDGRIQFFDNAGTYKGQVRYPTDIVGRKPILIDNRGDIYVTVGFPQDDVWGYSQGYTLISADGEVGEPQWVTAPDGWSDRHRDWQLTAHWGGGGMGPVPFAPSFEWAVGPGGVTASGITSEYGVTVSDQSGRSFQISRELPRVSVTAEENAFHRAYTTDGLRAWIPDWKWSGAEIPKQKPAFEEIRIAQTGEIWIIRAGSGEIADCPSFRFIDDWNSTCWRDRMFADIFSSEGRFLGEAALPAEFGRLYVAFLASSFILATVEAPDGNVVVKKYELRFEESDGPASH